MLLVTFILTLIFIRALHRPALSIGLVDVPSGRKTHSGDIPLTGGLAIVFSIITSFVFDWQIFYEFRIFFTSLLIIVFIGILDDIYELSAYIRLFVQTVVALVLILSDNVFITNIDNLIGSGNIQLKWFLVLFTVLFIIGITNSINMIDGIDGLAGGIVLIVLVFFSYAASIIGTTSHATLIYIIEGAVLAFLYFNMRLPWRAKAEVFLGDTGSTMLGFSIAWIAVSIIGISFTDPDGGAALLPIAVLWFVGLPVVDMLSLMARRVLKGRSPFSADREHIHHILEHAGFSHSHTVLLILATQLAMGLFGLVGWQARLPESVMLFSFLVVLLCYSQMIQHAWKVMKLLRFFHDSWGGKY